MAADAGDQRAVGRAVRLVDEHGLETIAELWADAAPVTLPGVLWQLYLLRTWVRTDGVGVARLYERGQHAAPVCDVVAGVADPPDPEAVAALGDTILTGASAGDLAVALERAAAFCRVVATGRASGHEDDSAELRLAVGNLAMAGHLEAAAALWRDDRLW